MKAVIVYMRASFLPNSSVTTSKTISCNRDDPTAKNN